MRSNAKMTKRSKKTRRLEPVQLLRPDQYEAFDVDSKLACIQALIPLGLMRIHELLEEEVCTLAGRWYERKSRAFPAAARGAILAVSGWRANGIPSGSLAYSTSPVGKCP